MAATQMRTRVVLALAAGLFFYALSDILLWQRIFESHDLFQFDMQYQTGHAATLVAMIGIGMLLLWNLGWSLWYGAAFYTLAFSGLEDVLYYWLDGKPIPTLCPWLDGAHNLILFHPASSSSLVWSSGLWLTFWAASLLLLPRLQAVLKAQLAPADPGLAELGGVETDRG